MPESLYLKISNTEWYLWSVLNRLLPYSRRGDNLSTLAWFLRWHRRWPKKNRLAYQDVLYNVKTSGELEGPLRVGTSDKELVKEFVTQEIGAEYCVRTLAVLRSVEECSSYTFPERCVIKPTHLSGPVILRKNGEPVDMSKFPQWFSDNYYYRTRERQYLSLQPKVIVEEFALEQDEPLDYKFFCYRGRPGMIQVNSDRFSSQRLNYYDVNWNLLPFEMTYPRNSREMERPANLEEMLSIAARVSSKFSLVRVDLYSDGKRAVVGELTHVPTNLRTHFYPLSGEDIASRLLFGAKERGD